MHQAYMDLLIKPVVNESQFVNTYAYEAFARRALASYGKWLPLAPSPELASVVASVITNGHIQQKKDGRYTYVGYFSDDIRDLNLFNELLKIVFKEKGKIKEWGVRVNGRSTASIVCNAAMVRVLSLCGAPLNDKIITKFSVPDWIKKGSIEIKKAFLKRSFSCEGSVYFGNYNKQWCISYSMYKWIDLKKDLMNYMETIQNLLLDFDIRSYLHCRQTHIRPKDNKAICGAQLRIRNKQSILNFSKNIGFDNFKKVDKLHNAVRTIMAG